MELQVEYVDIASLKNADWNPRYMPQEEMQALIRSIREYGCIQPLIVLKNTNEVIGGNQRLAAAREIGLQQVPVIYVDLPPEKAKALNIALNRISGTFDLPALARLLQEIAETDASLLDLTGMSHDELETLLGDLADELSEDEESESQDSVEDESSEQVTQDDGESLNFYRLRWGDLNELVSPATYNRFFTTFLQWQEQRDSNPTLDFFIQHLLDNCPKV